MAFDQSTRNRLARFVGDARRLVADEFTQQFQSLYGISSAGQITPVDQLAHLDEAERATAERLRERIRYLVQSHPETTKPDAAAVSRLAREQAFTVLNRLAAVRMAEKRGLIIESVGQGYQSRGFKVYETVAGSGLGDAYHRYRRYLFCLFDELAVDLGVLFDRRLPSGLLFPREKALLDLLALLNAPELDALWGEDETIGWIYQYYNDETERKKMREESSAPRNSRKLAVRNQFFTPRYVVEFLTDNTLGRLWYEMTRGQTRLKEQCRYLVRRPAEIFLPSPKTLFWHDVPGQTALRKFCVSGDPADLPASPELGALFGWLACLPRTPTPYFDGLQGNTLDGLGFAPELRAVGIDPHGVAERWQRFLGGETSAAEPDQAQTLELLHLLWLIPAQRASRGDHDWAIIDPVERLPAAAMLWRTLRDRLLNPLAGLSQEELLRQPVLIPFRPPKDPREIRLLDPACGSMHFGLYAFDLFETIYAEAWDLGLVPADAFGGDTPPFPHASVRVDRRQETVHSNDLHHPVSAATARVVLLKDADMGDGMMHAGPYITDDVRTFRPGTTWDEPFLTFDYVDALAAGEFTPEQGERLVRETPGAWEHHRIDPLPEEERLAVFRRAVPRLIIEHNLHGTDIDPRAVQIAGLSLWLRAQRAWHEAEILPADRPRITRSNLVCAEPMPGDREQLREFVEQQFPTGERPAFAFLLETIFDRMTLAGEAGSLLRIEEEIRTAVADAKRLWKQGPKAEQASLFAELGERAAQDEMRLDLSGITDEQFWERAEQRIYEALKAYAEQAENGGGFQRRLFADDAAQGFAFIDLCRRRYDVVVMNPPFGEAALTTRRYIAASFPESKGDLYAAFVSRGSKMLARGFLGVISNRTGFFLTGMRRWRESTLLGSPPLSLLADLGDGVLDGALVEAAAYVLGGSAGPCAFFRMLDQANKATPLLDAIGAVVAGRFGRGAFFDWLSEFKVFPESRMSYWAPPSVRDIFKKFQCASGNGLSVMFGLSTKDDFRFLRLCWEIQPHGIVFDQDRATHDLGWMYLAKGGEYALHYGDIHLVVRWANRGGEMAARVVQQYPYLNGDANWVLHLEVPYGRAGVTYTNRTTSGFSPRVLPKGCLISSMGCTIFADADEKLPRVLATYASRAFGYLLEFNVASGDSVHSGSAARHYEIGTVAAVPVPSVTDLKIRAGEDAIQIWRRKASADGRNEASRYFLLPWHTTSASSIRDSAAAIRQRDMKGFVEILDEASEAEKAVRELYGFDAPATEACEAEFGPDVTAYTPNISGKSIRALPKLWNASMSELVGDTSNELGFARFISKMTFLADRRLELICHRLRVHPQAIADSLRDLPATDPEAVEVAQTTLSYVFGSVLGRWDVRYATGHRPAPELPDPFAPLPVCPPGMLQGDDALPLSPEAGRRLRAEGSYPLDVAWDGILVDDPAHPLDLEGHIHAALAVLWGDRADALEHEACALLGVPTLREWFRRPAGFFADHLKRYSKSRRQAPIFWPLSTASGRYTIWLYYHRLTGQTMHRVIADFLSPKLRSVDQQIADGRESAVPGHAQGAGGATRLAELQELQDELIALRTELERVIALPWRPNLNDGVLITASPLWRLFRLGKWQKDLKACWDSLAAGEYDWAHLAYSIWPERVREKCRTDRSLAIAHGLEDLCTVAPPKPRAKRKGKAATLPEIED